MLTQDKRDWKTLTIYQVRIGPLQLLYNINHHLQKWCISSVTCRNGETRELLSTVLFSSWESPFVPDQKSAWSTKTEHSARAGVHFKTVQVETIHSICGSNSVSELGINIWQSCFTLNKVENAKKHNRSQLNW